MSFSPKSTYGCKSHKIVNRDVEIDTWKNKVKGIQKNNEILSSIDLAVICLNSRVINRKKK